MSYLTPHFDPDVFVSYSHGDPRGGGASDLKTWTHALLRKLENQILSLDTEFDDMLIWKDEQLDPTVHLTQDLRARVGASGILLIVMSKRYLASSWCRDELEWFRQQIQDRSTEQGRVFVLKAQPTDTATWPEFLRDERGHAMLGFSFYDPTNGMPYGWPDLQETNRDFVKEMCRLQTALTKRLRELRDHAVKRVQAEAAAKAPPVTATGARRIYLHAPADCEPTRIDIGKALNAEGIMSLSAAASQNAGMSAWQKDSGARIETAKRCEALALVRPGDPDRFVGDLLDIGVDERARISDARGAPLPCAVFDGTGVDLPIDVEPFGIKRFDVRQDSWHGEFRHWLDAARANPAQAAA